MSRTNLVERLKELLGESLVVTDAGAGWPALGILKNSHRGEIATAIYLAKIGGGGREGRAEERRIQNPSSGSPIQAHHGRVNLLLGIAEEKEGPVLVAWEAQRRLGRTTRYSAFVRREQLSEALREGTSIRESSNSEQIRAFRPQRLDWLLSLLPAPPNAAPPPPPSPMSKEPMHSDDDADDLDFEGLASNLAELSTGECPTGFTSINSFEASEINWSTNSWLGCVARVQEWLVLDDTIDLTQGPEEAISALFVGMGLVSADVGGCFTLAGSGSVQLTPTGLATLEERVSLAHARKCTFEEDLDEGYSRKNATLKWRSTWEDETDDRDRGSVEVNAEVATWKIKDFKDEAETGGLDLNPSYQRDVVWSNSESQKLLDSVLRGIPLPSIILNKRQESRVYEIVDGKQRLTAILRFIGRHPDGIKYAQERSTEEAPFELFETNYREWRRTLGIRSAEERRNCLPFSLSSYKNDSLQHLSRKYYHEIRDKTIRLQGRDELVKDLFERPNKSYVLPVIVYESTDLHQIHKVFGLYNKQGKKLNAEELRNAVYHHIGLTKLLLVLSGDSDRVQELAPYAEDLEIQAIPSLLKELGVPESRFHRTKIVSWVAALLLHEPRRNKANRLLTPSTSGYISALLKGISENGRHLMRHDENLKSFASLMIEGARLFHELWGEERAFAPDFTHSKEKGTKWEDLPTVATWTACVLAAVGGRTAEHAEDLAEPIFAMSKTRPPLKNQQSRTQWGYLARTILDLISAMALDRESLHGNLMKSLAFSCISPLNEINARSIKLT